MSEHPDKWIWRCMATIARRGKATDFRKGQAVGPRPAQRGIDQGWLLGTIASATLSPKAKKYMAEVEEARRQLLEAQ